MSSFACTEWMVRSSNRHRVKYQIVSDILRFCHIISSVCCVLCFTIQLKLCSAYYMCICRGTWDKARRTLFLLFLAYSVGRTIPTRNRWVAFIVFVLVCYAQCIPRICYWLLCFVFHSIRVFFTSAFLCLCFFLDPFVALSIFFGSPIAWSSFVSLCVCVYYVLLFNGQISTHQST